MYGIRSANVIREIGCQTKRYSSSFYLHSIKIWNNIGPQLREAPSLSVFKANIFKLIKPRKREILRFTTPLELKEFFS